MEEERANSSVLPPEELEEVPSTEDPKQQLSDTYITFIPKNSTGYTTKGHVVEIVIPKTEHVIDLAKSFIYLDLKIGLEHDNTGFHDEYIGENEELYVGLVNAATIFDQIRILNNGKVILNDTFCQVNSRIWQMTKPSHYLKQQYASFLNIDDISTNENFLVHKVDETTFTTPAIHNKVFKLKIPLPALFPCFDNATNFGTSQLTDDVTLSMQLSFPDRYLCWMIADSRTHKVKKICPFNTEAYGEYSASRNPETGASVIHRMHYVERNADGNDLYMIDNNMRIVCPAHYPTPTESEALTALVNNEGASYPFITCDIKEQKSDFSPAEDNRVINGDSVTSDESTHQLNYTTESNNIFAVLMMCSHYHSYVAFDKPYISNIETNLSELIKLANGKVHTGTTYDGDTERSGDNDMFKDLANALGADGFRNLERYDESIRRDYQQKDPTNQNMLASYIQYYQVSCGQMLGVSSDYFAGQINYKYKNIWGCEIRAGTGEGYTNVKYGVNTTGANNFKNSSVFCCVLTFKRLLFVNGGLDVENPLSDNYDIRNHLRGEVSGNAHGLLTTLIGPITNLMKSAGSTIRDEIHRIKRNKNTTHAYTQLGKEGYQRHKDIIDENATMGHLKFKRFIRNLIESERQLNSQSHGVEDALTQATQQSPSNALGGSASVSIGQGNQQIETEKGVDLSLLNLNVYHQQSRNADFADRIGWKHQLILDYKYCGNAQKLRLSSWGVETAIIGVSNSHGLGSWLKDKFKRLGGWIKNSVVPFLKGQGKQLFRNVKDVAKDYAQQILSGQIPIKDVPKRFFPYVNQILRDGSLTRDMDPKVLEAIETARKLRTGEMQWSQVPREIFEKIRSMNLDQPNAGNGLAIRNGLAVRHGFRKTIPYHPLPRGIMKRRVEMLLERNPYELRDKDLRRIYAYRYIKTHPLVDSHGTLGLTIRRLYGQPIYRRKLVSENPVNHGMLSSIKPYKQELINKYFDGDRAKWKEWRKSRKLPPHEDIPPVNSPFMQQVDVNHGCGDDEEEMYWKKHKAELKAKLLEKRKKKAAKK